MGVPLAESFSAPGVFGRNAEARSRYFCQHERILSPFFHSGNKKNEETEWREWRNENLWTGEALGLRLSFLALLHGPQLVPTIPHVKAWILESVGDFGFWDLGFPVWFITLRARC